MNPSLMSCGRPAVLVAARLSSSRLPGKALMDFGGQPLLKHVVNAASAAQGTGPTVVVTSLDSSDDPIVRWCEANSLDVWRGDLNDVAGRMLGAAKHFGAETFVRISGDSPMLDPRVISFAVQRFNLFTPDLVTNVRPRTFPPGQSVEVVRTRTFEHLLSIDSGSPEEREHVTPVLYRHEQDIEIKRFAPSDLTSFNIDRIGPYRSLTIDTPQDADCFRLAMHNAGSTNMWVHGWERCETMMRIADQQVQSTSEK